MTSWAASSCSGMSASIGALFGTVIVTSTWMPRRRRAASLAAVATAIKLAARRRRGIHVLVTINVPASSPIDASLPDQELAAQAVIEEAKLLGGRRVSGHYEKVRIGQAGRLIVNEARHMRAAAIVLSLPPRRGNVLFGPTVETVLAERPCRVIIQTAEDGADATRSRQALHA